MKNIIFRFVELSHLSSFIIFSFYSTNLHHGQGNWSFKKNIWSKLSTSTLKKPVLLSSADHTSPASNSTRIPISYQLDNKDITTNKKKNNTSNTDDIHSCVTVIYPTRNWWTLSFLTGSHIIYLVMCLNGNKYWCCVINVLNITLVENFHLGLDGFSSTLFFLAEILALKLGIKTMINFNKFIQFIFKKLNCCLIKGRYVITKIRMISQIISFISVWWITFCICEI